MKIINSNIKVELFKWNSIKKLKIMDSFNLVQLKDKADLSQLESWAMQI